MQRQQGQQASSRDLYLTAHHQKHSQDSLEKLNNTAKDML